MSRLLWRISDYADMSGLGGRLTSGRWHTKGLPVIYAAESSTGALSELLVHLDRDLIAPDFQLLTLEMPVSIVVESLSSLPENWKSELGISRAWGDRWLRSRKSPLLKVPSALVPHAYNMLINPLHPDAASIGIIDRQRVVLDPRFK